nr:olfactory receptor 24 [Tropidothorax elegans]
MLQKSNGEIGEPLSVLEHALEFAGMLPRISGVRPWFYPISVVFSHIIYFNCYLCTFLFLISDAPFFDKMESFQCFLSLIHMFAKYINLHYNTGPYRKLVETSKKLWEDAKLRPENHELMKEIHRESDLSMKGLLVMFAGAVPTSAIMTGLYNMQVEPEKRETLYMVWDPVPDDSWYWTSCFYEAICMSSSLMLLATSLAACYGHCLQAAGQMRILQAMLGSKVVDVKACAVLHQNVLKYIQHIQDYFAGQMFLEVVLSSLQNSMRCYMCMRMASQGDPKAVGATFILILCMSGPFIVCLSGHVITDNA